jgi:hypothetical protein
MTIKRLGVAIALGAALTAGGAQAASIINPDNPAGHSWTGFDWAQGGTAYTVGFDTTAGTQFTLQYFAWAVQLQDGINPFPPLDQAHLDTVANGSRPLGGYEYTIVATIQETVVGCVGSVCTFNVNSGTFQVYYDDAVQGGAAADARGGLLGTGFDDGAVILSGTVDPLAGQTFNLVTGSNSTTLHGAVTFTDTAFIQPPQDRTTATTTLQIGGAITNWVNPGGFDGTAWGAIPGVTQPPDVVFQADGNQSFAVPEPTSVALIGLGLAAFGLGYRRRQQ